MAILFEPRWRALGTHRPPLTPGQPPLFPLYRLGQVQDQSRLPEPVLRPET
jgi:hypothetical protein